jgi:hypothetical protein
MQPLADGRFDCWFRPPATSSSSGRLPPQRGPLARILQAHESARAWIPRIPGLSRLRRKVARQVESGALQRERVSDPDRGSGPVLYGRVSAAERARLFATAVANRSMLCAPASA